MSEIVQWIMVAVIVAAAVVYLVKHLKPSKKGCCCSGCPYAGSCASEREDVGDCPVPPDARTDQGHE